MKASNWHLVVYWIWAVWGMPNLAMGQQWADLKMKFVLEGEIPAPVVINAIGANLISEGLVVDPESHGIANVIFIIDSNRTKLELNQIHPSLRELPTEKPILENKNTRVIPHVLAIRKGQTLVLRNWDRVLSNFTFAFYQNPATNITLPGGMQSEVEIQEEESIPVKVQSSIHPWINAYLLVTDYPYVGISDNEGNVKIERLPAGVDLAFRMWHENQNKSIAKVRLNGQDVTWTKGQVTLNLKEGVNDLGEILISRNRFRE